MKSLYLTNEIRSYLSMISTKILVESCSVEFVKYQNNGSITIMIQSANFLEGTCVRRFSLKIKAYHCGARCTIKTLSQNRIHVIKRWSHIEEASVFKCLTKQRLKRSNSPINCFYGCLNITV